MAESEHTPIQASARSASPRTPNWTVVILVLLATTFSLLPVLLGLSAPAHPRHAIVLYGMLYGPVLLGVLLCYFLDHKLDRKQKLDALLLCVVLASKAGQPCTSVIGKGTGSAAAERMTNRLPSGVTSKFPGPTPK